MHTFMHSWILHAIQWIMNTFLRPVCVLYGLVNTSTTFDWGWSAIMLSRRAFITNLMLSSKVLWNVGSLIFAENSWIFYQILLTVSKFIFKIQISTAVLHSHVKWPSFILNLRKLIFVFIIFYGRFFIRSIFSVNCNGISSLRFDGTW